MTCGTRLLDLGAVADAASSCVFHGGEIARYSGDEDGVGTRLVVRLRGRTSLVVRGVAIPDVASCVAMLDCFALGLQDGEDQSAACRNELMIHTDH